MFFGVANISQVSRNIFFLFYEFESMFLGVANHIQSRCKTHVLQPPKFEEQQHFHIFSGQVYFCNFVKKSQSQSCKVVFFSVLIALHLGGYKNPHWIYSLEYCSFFAMKYQCISSLISRRIVLGEELVSVKWWNNFVGLWSSETPPSPCVSWDHWQSSSHAE